MKRIAISLFSIGWLVPAWLAVSTLLTFVNSEVWPLLRGERPVNSFPFVAFATDCLAVTFLWLAVVIAYWAWRLAPLGRGKKQPIQAPETTHASTR